MSEPFKVYQHKDEDGKRYGKSKTCPNKCYWQEGDRFKLCHFYNIMQVGEEQKEWCDDDQDC